MCKREHAFRIPNDSLTQPSLSIPQSIKSFNKHTLLCCFIRHAALVCIIWYGSRSARQGAAQAIISWSYVTGWGSAWSLGWVMLESHHVAPCSLLFKAFEVLLSLFRQTFPRASQCSYALLHLKHPPRNLFCCAPTSLSHVPRRFVGVRCSKDRGSEQGALASLW